MKANEFFKKFGWDEAKEIVEGLPEKFKFKPLGGVFVGITTLTSIQIDLNQEIVW